MCADTAAYISTCPVAAVQKGLLSADRLPALMSAQRQGCAHTGVLILQHTSRNALQLLPGRASYKLADCLRRCLRRRMVAHTGVQIVQHTSTLAL